MALFTRDGGAARRFRREAPVGMVGVNVAIPVPMAYHSFGGWKDSLFGDHHVHGPEGIRFYTRLKAVTEHWPDPRRPRRRPRLPHRPLSRRRSARRMFRGASISSRHRHPHDVHVTLGVRDE